MQFPYLQSRNLISSNPDPKTNTTSLTLLRIDLTNNEWITMLHTKWSYVWLYIHVNVILADFYCYIIHLWYFFCYLVEVLWGFLNQSHHRWIQPNPDVHWGMTCPRGWNMHAHAPRRRNGKHAWRTNGNKKQSTTPTLMQIPTLTPH
jgi:hypothetical protein